MPSTAISNPFSHVHRQQLLETSESIALPLKGPHGWHPTAHAQSCTYWLFSYCGCPSVRIPFVCGEATSGLSERSAPLAQSRALP